MPNATDDNAPREVSRRGLFKQVGAAGAAAMAGNPLAAGAVMAQDHQQHAAPATLAATAQLEALETLTAAEADTLEAIAAQGVAVDDWADDNFDHAGLDFIGGGNLWVYSDRRPIAATSMSTYDKAPTWGSAWKAFIKQNADRYNVAYLQKTTLPYEDNYLDLDPVVKDPMGFPVIRITADHKDNEKKMGAFVQDKMAQWFMEAGAIAVEKGPTGTMGPSTHAYGGTRMGDGRETNVVDRFGFSHEVPNLGIVGASVMGTSGAHNPTLTAQALAWRTADHLAANWNAIAKR
jgi:gluconate 2-dehydrogenase alpha chain